MVRIIDYHNIYIDSRSYPINAKNKICQPFIQAGKSVIMFPIIYIMSNSRYGYLFFRLGFYLLALCIFKMDGTN